MALKRMPEGMKQIKWFLKFQIFKAGKQNAEDLRVEN